MMRNARVDHFAVAAACRANPGEWQPVGEYNSTQSAYGAMGHISRAVVTTTSQQSAYTPAGSFEARQELTEFGARVEARFVGTADDAAWTDAVLALVGGAA
jgi:hypothetical protein